MDNKKAVYIRCPRCELNYILKKDKLCSVCKAELSAKKDEDLIDELDLELCPICKTNYIQSDEVMCSSCLAERSLSSGEITEDDWEEYINRDDNEIILPEEEAGDMAAISDLDDDILDVEESEDLVFDDDEEDSEEVEEEENLDDDDNDDDFYYDDDDD